MSFLRRNIALIVIIFVIFIIVYHFFNPAHKWKEEIIFSDFVELIETKQVSEVVIQGENVIGTLNNGKIFLTYLPKNNSIIQQLQEKKVRILVKPLEESPWYINIFISWLPTLLLVGVWIFFMRQIQTGGGKAMSFGKSRAKLMNHKKKKITFDDVAGIDEAKIELQEIVEFLKDPKKFTCVGGRIPKGILLVGAPGTGKTLLARAIAGEANVSFFSISGSDFVEMFVGVGASRVRDLFKEGKRNAPCIIFIDEIDAVGRYRGAGLGGGHDEREQTLNQLLVEMDGFESNEGVILISATNRPDVLDPALLRPGRFDRQVVVPYPDIKGREKIFEVHAKKLPLANDINFSILSRGTPGLSGADIENLVNEAALAAARDNRNIVNMSDFEFAKDKILMGSERKTLVITDKERKITAYHEAGHALVAKLIPDTDPIYKVTIIPRGRALGITQQLPKNEMHTYSKQYLLNNISIMLGGRAAEEIVHKDFTTGSGADIERATELVKKMVCEWGMSELMGPLAYGKRQEQVFLGREFVKHKDYSENTAAKIDQEILKIITESYQRAKKLLTLNIGLLHNLSAHLLEKEVLTAEEINLIMNKHFPIQKK